MLHSKKKAIFAFLTIFQPTIIQNINHSLLAVKNKTIFMAKINLEKLFRRIDKYYPSYKAVRDFSMFTQRYFFYNSISFYGKENIPKNEPYMIAPNHQNALMDALIIIDSFKRPIFIARADLFSIKLLAKFVSWGRMMPAFRIRDGKANLHKNELIVKRSAEALKNNSPIIVFPEATHNHKRRLLTLKKGLARIAFHTEKITDFSLNLSVVPAGIYYDNYFNAGSNVTVIFGKPVKINEFKDVFFENEKKGLHSFNKKLAEEIKKVTINIDSEEYYDTYELLRYMYREEMYKIVNLTDNTPLNDIIADKELIKQLDEFNLVKPVEMKKLHTKTMDYKSLLNKTKLRDWVVKSEGFNSFKLLLNSIIAILLFPLNLYAYINNFFPFLPQMLINKKVTDPQFYSSVKWLLGTLITPILWLLQMLIVGLLTDIWWIKWVYLISLPLAYFFNLHYYKFFVKLRASIKFNYWLKKKNKLALELISLRKEITDKLKNIIK